MAAVQETVDKVKALLPDLNRFIPASVTISVVSDRTSTIRASIADLMITLGAAIMLVMMVVMLFLRRAAQTDLRIAAITPLSNRVPFALFDLTMALVLVAIAIGFHALHLGGESVRALERGIGEIGFDQPRLIENGAIEFRAL